VILFVNRLIKVEMTPCLIYTDFVAQIKSSSGLFIFFALSWHVALLWPACGPDLANRSGPPKGRHSLLHVGKIRIPQVPDVGRNNVAMWDTYSKITGF